MKKIRVRWVILGAMIAVQTLLFISFWLVHARWYAIAGSVLVQGCYGFYLGYVYGRKLPPGQMVFKSFNWVRWLFGKKSRHYLDLVAADLRRDQKEMLAKGFNPLYILLCLYWGALRSVLPIITRGLLALLAIEQLIRKFRK